MKPVGTPKVFISYSWGTDTYQEKVLEFCIRLRAECGIEVLVDKWSMDAGNDTYDFMERCAKDPSVNYVIMLLDKNYSEKADSRQGGVGIETQIISAKVYADIEQSKFIPVVFERGANGEVYKPAYLLSRLHFDLTKENANDEFMRLVRHLYGEKTHPIPALGIKPDWVSQPMVISPVVAGSLYTISNAIDESVIRREIIKVLRSIKEAVFDLNLSCEEINHFQNEPQHYLDFLDKFRPYRDAVISALSRITHKEYFGDLFADFSEEFKQANDDNRSPHAYLSQATGSLLHEVFIYTIALLWSDEEYAKILNLIIRTYFTGGKFRTHSTTNYDNIFYSGGHTDLIDDAKRKVDNKKYYSGLAQLWSEHIMSGFSRDQVVFADMLIHNVSVFEEPEGSRYWFPKLYVYGLENPIFSRLAIRLKSAHQIERIKGLFGDSSPAGINERVNKMSKLIYTDRYRYNDSFDRAPLILDYVKANGIGKLP